MMVLSILMKTKMIQIPVNYTKRVGHASVSGNKWVAFRLGLRMIWVIFWVFPTSPYRRRKECSCA